MNREALERPFASHLIKTRPGQGGKRLSYVEGAEYIRRLNEAFEGEWAFEVVEYQILDTEVIVLGKLEAGGVTKTAFGGHRRAAGAELADALKAAQTDALKKAASLFGLGLHLYSDAPRRPQRAGSPRSVQPLGGQYTQGRAQKRPPRASEWQRARIKGLATNLGLDEAKLEWCLKQRYAARLEQLDAEQAEQAIRKLEVRVKGAAA